MNKRRTQLIMFGLFLMLLITSKSEATIFINEILADPALGVLGDANGDGIRSISDDEFIEFYNAGDIFVDLSGWIISDASSVRHIFLSSTLLNPKEYLVVFGGGSPLLQQIQWQLASSETLSLNNTSETVSLFDNHNQLIDQIVYGTLANNDQSIVRLKKEIGSEFVLHSVASIDQEIFSPGRNTNSVNSSTYPVPEPGTLTTLLLGAAQLMLRSKKSKDQI